MDKHDFDQMDSLVGDYLSFRNYFDSAEVLEEERQRPQRRASQVTAKANPEAVKERILSSFIQGDYPRILTLWDTYIIQALKDRSAQIAAEARTAEFYINLQCATFPFRSDVMKKLGNPGVAARTAARSMTIFRHYLESRGKNMVTMREFSVYKSLHKIAFPPTHPSFSHLFHDKWIPMAMANVETFLDRFFDTTDLPELCQMYLNKVTGAAAAGADVDEREQELRDAFKQRERKLMQFARSMFDLSKELLDKTDTSGQRPLDPDFLVGFKHKFAAFQEVLDPASLLSQPNSPRGPANGHKPMPPQEQRPQQQMTRTNNIPAAPDRSQDGPEAMTPRDTGKAGYRSTVPGPHEALKPTELNYDLIVGDLVHIAAEAESSLLGSGALAPDRLESVSANLGRGAELLRAMLRVFSRRLHHGGDSTEEDDMIAMQMARNDILGFGGGQFDEGQVGTRLGAVGGGPLTSLLTTLSRTVANSNETGVSETGRKLLDQCSYFIVHLGHFIASLTLTVPGNTYSSQHGVLLTQALVDLLVAIPFEDDFSGKRRKGLSTRQTVSAIALLALSFRTRQSQTALVRRGIVSWQATAFMSNRLDASDMMLHTYLLRAVCTNQDAQRALCSSPTVQRQTETLLTALMELLVAKTTAQNTPELKANLAATLELFIQEPDMREVAKALNYKEKLHHVGATLDIEGADAVHRLCDVLESTKPPEPMSAERRGGFHSEVTAYLCSVLVSALEDQSISGSLSHYGSMEGSGGHTGGSPYGKGPDLPEDMRSLPRLPRTPDGGGNPRYLDHSKDLVQAEEYEEMNEDGTGPDYSANPGAVPFAPPVWNGENDGGGGGGNTGAGEEAEMVQGNEEEDWTPNDDNLGRSRDEKGRQMFAADLLDDEEGGGDGDGDGGGSGGDDDDDEVEEEESGGKDDEMN